MKRTLGTVLLLGLLGCLERNHVALEFRVVEDEPTPGLLAVVFAPTGERFHLHGQVLVTPADVDSAFVVARVGRLAVELVLTPQGAGKLEELTERNVGKRCGMVLGGQLVSAPRIMAPIRVGRAIVAGDFTEAEAGRIVRGLSRL